jgi:hypothetical protein
VGGEGQPAQKMCEWGLLCLFEQAGRLAYENNVSVDDCFEQATSLSLVQREGSRRKPTSLGTQL